MKLLLTIILAICCFSNSQAQTHNYQQGWCRFAKPVKGSVQGESAKLQCMACIKDKETEQKARLAEDKRRADVIAADYKAKKEVELKATALKKIEDAKNAESGKVYINGNKSDGNSPKTIKGTTKIISKNDNTNSKLFPASTFDFEGLRTSFIVNGNGDTIRSSSKWIACGWNKLISKEDIPTDVIIVVYEEQGKVMNSKYYNYHNKERFALINSKGEELLDEKRISYLNYVGNDFFVYTFVNDNDNILSKFNSDPTDNLSNNGCGRTVVLFDYKLNKKYYFNEEFTCIKAIFQPTLKDGILLEFALAKYHLYADTFTDKYIVNSQREYIKVNN